MSEVTDGSAVGLTPTTTAEYLPSAGVPFLSTRLTVNSVPLPLKFLSGVNVTVPSSATVYVPSPSIVTVVTSCPVLGSISFAGTLLSISTVFSTPSIVTLPPMKFGLPLCTLP